jgi:AraC-like DNA-binding protein
MRVRSSRERDCKPRQAVSTVLPALAEGHDGPIPSPMAANEPEFRAPDFGRERLNPFTRIPRHRHRHGYIAVVLSGGYREAGLSGRFDLSAGDVVTHGPFDAHLDHICAGGAEVLNLPLPPGSPVAVAFKIGDADAIAKIAEKDPVEAALALVPEGEVCRPADWPDLLARDIVDEPGISLRGWARARGLAPETLSRGFRHAYGVTPARYRGEVKAQRALTLVEFGGESLAAIAADCRYADQPHLTRAFVRLTGMPPGAWRRRSIPFKNGGSPVS